MRLVLMVLAMLVVASPLAAQCPERVRAWARTCDPGLEPVLCDDGVVVVRARSDGAPPLAIELRSSAEGAFRRAGSIGISPVAEIADWRTAPRPWHDALDRIARCEPPPFGAIGRGASTQQGTAGRPPRLVASPWRAIAGLALVLVVLADRRRLAAWFRGRAVALVLMPPLALALRAALFDEAFFHQNGQGPIWIEMALCHASPYGPGYRELFGEAASIGGVEPERAVFLAQSILLSLGPALAFVLVRAMGGSLALASFGALALALDPLLGRLARSESYFASQSLLLLAAAAALSVGARGHRVRFALAVLGAGLLAAQASRVHPVSWVPIALLPACVLVTPGRSTRRRAIEAAIAAIGIAALVGLTSGETMLEQVRGQLVSDWGGRTGQRFAMPEVPWEALAAAAACVALARSRRRAIVRAAALFVCVLAVDRVGSVAPWSEVVRGSNAHLYAPLLAVAVACVASSRARNVISAISMVAVTLLFAWRWQAWTQLPTDALEQRIALEWRARMNDGDTVLYLERAEDRVQHLPIYQCVAGHPRVIAAQAPAALTTSVATNGPLWLVETSLCATREGREACARLRDGLSLETVEERELPARPSAPYQPYEAPTLRMRLSRRR